MIRVGLLGTGFGETHAEIYNRLDNFELKSIFGRNAGKLAELAETTGAETTSEIESILNDPEIDLVDIALPTEVHAHWAVEALRRGKHVFIETPVAYALSDAETIQKASQEAGKHVFVDLFIKFSAAHRIAAELVRKGEFGGLRSVRAYNHTSPQWGDLSLKKNVETFHNHLVDFAIGLVGMPTGVTASGVELGEGQSVVTTLLSYPNQLVSLESNSGMPECAPFLIGFELIFANGVARYDALFGDYEREEFSVATDAGRKLLELPETDDYEEVIKHVGQCIEAGRRSDDIDISNAVAGVMVKQQILEALGIADS